MLKAAVSPHATGDPSKIDCRRRRKSTSQRGNKIMAEKQPKTPAEKNSPKNKQDQGKRKDKTADHSPEPEAVDRPGFDLGGSTGKTSAGTGLGPGQDAADNRSDRSLPGRRGKRT
jgi:hypothetical protein